VKPRRHNTLYFYGFSTSLPSAWASTSARSHSMGWYSMFHRFLQGLLENIVPCLHLGRGRVIKPGRSRVGQEIDQRHHCPAPGPRHELFSQFIAEDQIHQMEANGL